LLKIIADKNIYKLDQFLNDNVKLTTFDPNDPLLGLETYDALFVRTVTKLNSQNLERIPESLKLIGTGSSGSDHIEKEYFKSRGVQVIDAKGSNADAVSEYVITSLLLWSIKRGKKLTNLKVGIIGAGATGSAVADQLSRFEIPFLSYDPPREQRDKNFSSASLKDILECDILTFHVPLEKEGAHPTFHWLDESKLSANSFELIINASRGGVIDELALLNAVRENTVGDIIIDVWEGEPDFNTAVAEAAFIATPHIAGYSEQAKINASKMLVEQFSEFFDVEVPNSSKLYRSKEIDLADLNYTAYELILRLHPLREYDADLRDLNLRPDKSILFQKLRTDRPYRYEYPYISLDKTLLDEFNILKKLGVKPLTNT
jgi:erythronate-4-phosphate dehydrogenase